MVAGQDILRRRRLSRGWILLIGLGIAGCAATRAPVVRWDSEPSGRFLECWKDRQGQTETVALLARVDFRGESESHSFTLEVFYRAPALYLIRGRGTLGVTGFRARLSDDSLVLLLDRERRGFAGDPAAYPDTATRGMWKLLWRALPWLVGQARLDSGSAWRVATASGAARPEVLEVLSDEGELHLRYGRYRSEYPFWHLRSAHGRSPRGNLSLDIRQQLYNPPLADALFELTLPPGTRPLVD